MLPRRGPSSCTTGSSVWADLPVARCQPWPKQSPCNPIFKGRRSFEPRQRSSSTTLKLQKIEFAPQSAFKSPICPTMLAAMIRVIGISALIALLLPAVSLAQTPSEIGTYKKWSAYKLKQTSGRSCYMASQPTRSCGTCQVPSGLNRKGIPCGLSKLRHPVPLL